MASVTTDRRRGVDTSAAVKVPVLYASTGNISSLSGTTQTIDGQTASSGRILVWNQSSAAENGIYDIGSTWTRAYDFDSSAEIAQGTLIYCSSGGTVYGNTFFVVTSSAAVPGSSNMAFARRNSEMAGAGTFGSTFFSAATTSSAFSIMGLSTALTQITAVPVPVSQGGTSATSTANALAALGALSSTLAQGAIFVGSAGATAASLAVGASGLELVSTGGTLAYRIPPGPRRALLTHETTSGAYGGGTSAAVWGTRPLTTEVYDPDGIVSLAANQAALQIGTYVVSAWQHLAVVGATFQARSRFRNISSTQTVAVSVNDGASDAAVDTCLAAIPPTQFAATSSAIFELQYWVTVLTSSTGLGYPSSSGEVERYAAVYIEMISTTT